MANTISRQSQIEKDVLEQLARLGGQRVTQEDIAREGTRFVIPETMTINEAISYLKDFNESMETYHVFSRTYKYRQLDGAHAVKAAMQKIFGSLGRQRGFFIFPPEVKSIAVAFDQTEQVPTGVISLPMFGDEAGMYIGEKTDPELGSLFHLEINAPKKYAAHAEGLFQAIEEELRTNSIYKGKAVDGQKEPEFLDLRGVNPDKVIYTDEVTTQLSANIWSLLRHTDTMRELDVPLKRSILLTGDYGSGKTLAAFLTAQEAVTNGWTFIYCRPNRDNLVEVMSTARLYQPSVVFYEDVDTVAEGQAGDRDSIAQLLDMFDGIAAKGTEMMAILTTNHEKRIHKGMIRPGRLDAVVHIGELDPPAVERLIRSRVPDKLLDKRTDFDRIGEAMDGYLPAFIVEAVDRAIRYAVDRTKGNPKSLTTEDFVAAGNGLRAQLDLMKGAHEGKERQPLDTALRSTVGEVVASIVDDTDVKRSDGREFGTLEHK